MKLSLFFTGLFFPILSLAQLQMLKVDHNSQDSLHLTVYNSFALVRDSRELVLPEGELLLEFEEVAQTLVPSSVSVSAKEQANFDVLEQSYRYDLLNRQSLLETYIGRKLKYSRTVLQGETYEKVLREGILLSTNPEIVDFGDEIEISPVGVISLPDVPDGLTLSPTLVWKINNEKTGKQNITTSYVANHISWQADYVMRLDEGRKTLDLTSWATVRNDSGTIFEDATIRLVAGEVGRVPSRPPERQIEAAVYSVRTDSGAAQKRLQSGESNAYQAYDLPNRTTLINHESKQLKFVEASRVPYEQSYHLRGAAEAYANSNASVSAVVTKIQFENTRANRLGLALAEGVVRMYLDSEHAADLLGEAQFTSTPIGKQVELELGQAFDITAERIQTSWTRLNDRSIEVSYKISLSNAKTDAVTVSVEEAMQGQWQILKSSHEMKRASSQIASAELKIEPGMTETLSYKVRFRY